MDLKKHIFLYGFVFLSATLSSCFAHTDLTNIVLKNSIPSDEKSYSKNKKEFSEDTQTTDSSSSLTAKEAEDLTSTTTPIFTDTSSMETINYENITAAGIVKVAAKNVAHDDLFCTCGIFLSSQFIKGSSKQPKSEPIISNTLEKQFVCTPIGKKQCQTKCLEQIVQHLPNSASIICASLDRDIRKERAYLFVRNCSSKWHNTNLAAGREYCCKNGLPYTCPKK